MPKQSPMRQRNSTKAPLKETDFPLEADVTTGARFLIRAGNPAEQCAGVILEKVQMLLKQK